MSAPAVRITLLLAALACPHAAWAQPAPRTTAAEHFDRGVQFFAEERYDAALAEFDRAHALAPAHQTLYNLAQAHAALGHAVQAAAAYERYLREAPSDIGPRRRREAEQALTEQRARIGHLTIRTDVAGATVSVDGVDVATTPLDRPLPLAAGSHTVELRAPGRESARVAVTLAGREERSLEVTLRASEQPRGTLRVEASLPEVAIAIDGEVVGTTPLASTVPLPAGTHRVAARRPGYREDQRTVTIEDGAEAEVRFALQRDPTPPADAVGRVHLRMPDAPYLVRVDGEAMLGEELELPIGSHRLELEVPERRPYEGMVRVAANRTIEIAPALSWTLEARRARAEGARAQTLAGATSTIAGGVVLAAGLGLLIWNESEIARTDARIVEVLEQVRVCDETDMPQEICDALTTEGAQLADRQSTQDVTRGLSIAAVALGAGATLIGAVLWISAPSESEIDAAARARAQLRIGLDGASFEGVF